MSAEAIDFPRMLDLVESGTDRFTTKNEVIQEHRIFGGQLLAQATEAAHRTVEDGRPAHSIHAYFLRAGVVDVPIEFRVDRLSDGRTLAHRRVEAVQEGRLLFQATLSFQSDEQGPRHQPPPFQVPGPDEVSPAETMLTTALPNTGFEVRPIQGADAAQLGGEDVGRRALWFRNRGPVRDDPAFHQAALLFVSDNTLFTSTFSVHGLSQSELRKPGALVTSIDHSLWWHEPARVDEWVLFVHDSRQAGRARTLIDVNLYSADGTHVASAAQELLVRLPGLGNED